MLCSGIIDVRNNCGACHRFPPAIAEISERLIAKKSVMTVEIPENEANIYPMGKHETMRVGKRPGRFVAGLAADGVQIRKPAGPATHFTSREVAKAVAAVIAAEDKGRNGARRSPYKKG
jgi:hypothetical protein